MARVHLFEFEDQSWFPAFIRDYMTDFLQFLSNKTKMFRPLIPIIQKAMKDSNTNQIIDLGSGGGGGLLDLNSELLKENPNLKITLSDFYPNIAAFKYIQSKQTNINFEEKSVDARDVPVKLEGLRTQFLSLHHFKPNDARQILQNAVDSGNSIAIFEGQERSFPSILAMIFSPISVILTTPFIFPFKIGRLVFTYIIPIVPLVVMWDGIVSSLRTYSVKEMNQLILEVKGHETYNWDVNRIKSGPGMLLYLVGTKK